MYSQDDDGPSVRYKGQQKFHLKPHHNHAHNHIYNYLQIKPTQTNPILKMQFSTSIIMAFAAFASMASACNTWNVRHHSSVPFSLSRTNEWIRTAPEARSATLLPPTAPALDPVSPTARAIATGEPRNSLASRWDFGHEKGWGIREIAEMVRWWEEGVENRDGLASQTGILFLRLDGHLANLARYLYDGAVVNNAIIVSFKNIAGVLKAGDET
jgi:hypothetical protein